MRKGEVWVEELLNRRNEAYEITKDERVRGKEKGRKVNRIEITP